MILCKERRDSGGSLSEDWNRNDVSSILNHIHSYGYRIDFTHCPLVLSKEYNIEEVRDANISWYITVLIYATMQIKRIMPLYSARNL